MNDKIQYNNIMAQMDKFGADLVKELAQQLILSGKEATGSLVKSLDYELIELLGDIVINITANDYLYYVDKGRKPNRKAPPSGVIVKWMDVKGIKGRDKKTGRFIKKESAAFLIARSIGKKGIKPTNVIKKSINRLLKAKSKLIAKAAGEDLKEYTKNVLINAYS